MFVVVVTTCSTDTTNGGSGNTTTGAVGIAMEKVCTNKTMPDLNSADFSVLKPMLEPFSVTTNTALNCIHFSESGSATATGDSWANALSTDQLKTKLDVISDASNSKVYILLLAKGTYTPTTLATDETARETSFTMKNHTAIIGGWNNAYDFNIETYTTLLSGDIGEENDKTDNSYHIIFNNNLTSSAILYGVTLSHGYANGTAAPHDKGGAIYNKSSHPTITQSSFSNNSARSEGGAIYNLQSNPTISKLSFSNNSATTSGGAIYNNLSNPTITQLSFSNNSATTSGGAIYNESSHPTITQLSFSNNSANNRGGAIYNLQSNPTITQSSFSNNSASTDGGAIYNNLSNPTITQLSFSNNSATTSGGAIYNESSHPTITQLSFSTNTSNFGGAIYNTSSHPTITQSSFSNNSANNRGGAIHNLVSNPTITQSSFSNNSGNYGGAIFQDNDEKDGTTLANVILWGNTAPNGSQIYLNTDGGGNENLILGSVILQDGVDNIGFAPTKPNEKQVSEHNIFTTDPGLGAFANNGGLVQTFSISDNSSAIDKGLYIKIKNDYSAFYYSSDSSTWYTTPVLAGTNTTPNTAVTPHTDSFKLATDARGYKFKGKPDIGDYEYNGIAPTP